MLAIGLLVVAVFGIGLSIGLILFGIISEDNRGLLKGAVITLLLSILAGVIAFVINPGLLPKKRPAETAVEEASPSPSSTLEEESSEEEQVIEE